MSLVREGIENVRVYTLPDGVGADGRRAAVSGAALVTWHASHTDMLYQVYLNGRLAGSTIDGEQRRLVVQSPSSLQSAVRVTVIGVDPADAHMDFADNLEQVMPCSGRVRLTLLRSQALPLDATANIYGDNGTGQIDYTAPINALPIPIWPCRQDKAGLGMAQFGTRDFGYDAAASVGFGKGALGYDQFGLDADSLEWISPSLPLGEYRFGVRIADASGNEGPAIETAPIAVTPAAMPAAGLEVAAFYPQTNELTLTVIG
jgi:hypothetical protein